MAYMCFNTNISHSTRTHMNTYLGILILSELVIVYYCSSIVAEHNLVLYFFKEGY